MTSRPFRPGRPPLALRPKTPRPASSPWRPGRRPPWPTTSGRSGSRTGSPPPRPAWSVTPATWPRPWRRCTWRCGSCPSSSRAPWPDRPHADSLEHRMACMSPARPRLILAQPTDGSRQATSRMLDSRACAAGRGL